MPEDERTRIIFKRGGVPGHSQEIAREIARVNATIEYDAPREGPVPNDLHIDWRPLSAFEKKWERVVTLGPFSPLPGPGGPLELNVQFLKPKEPGTYDVRVTWTLDGKALSRRTGQIFVK
jgi:hypothetical protein